MGFDDWLSEQDQARRESANSQAADDQIRSVNAAKVVDALAAELRTVIPRLRTFPAVTVQEHRVDITASVTGSTVTVPNRHRSYEAPEGDIAAHRNPVGHSRTAWAFEGMWLDEDGHLWFEVRVNAHGGLFRREYLSGGASCAENAMVPLRGENVARWVTAAGKGAASVTMNGQAWAPSGYVAEVSGVPIHISQSSPRHPQFFEGSRWSRIPADLLRGDTSEMFVGFANYDDAATVARDFIFESVQIALQQGRRTL